MFPTRNWKKEFLLLCPLADFPVTAVLAPFNEWCRLRYYLCFDYLVYQLNRFSHFAQIFCKPVVRLAYPHSKLWGITARRNLLA